MNLSKEWFHKSLQGKRTAGEAVSRTEDAKRKKFISSTTSVIYDYISSSKENMTSEMPIDMSRGSKFDVMDVEQQTQSVDLSVRLLREKLRNEETALLLLRKLRRSQLSLALRGGISLPSTNISVYQNHVSRNGTVTAQSSLIARQQFTNHVVPQKSSAAPGQHDGTFQQQVPAHSKTPANGTTLKESNIRTQPMRPPAAAQQSNEKTLAQRQALAKLAIRRQLEATLLQLPMPKYTPQEMSFIPTIGFYSDFIALVGMEEAIKYILNEKAVTESVAEVEKLQPLQCARCKTDFTPLWKADELDATCVICKQCAVAGQKQAFRQEHTARLKSAFYQALQQERQIEAGGNIDGAMV